MNHSIIKTNIVGIVVTLVVIATVGSAKKELADSSEWAATRHSARHPRSPRHQYSYVVHRPYLPMATGYGHPGYHGPPWHRMGHHGHGHGYGGGHGYKHGHGNKGFYKSHKTGFHKGHGYKGKKGFRDKEGLKKKAHGNHGKWKHKGYHDKDGKKYKGHKHKKKYYGDIHKGFKGNKGHHFGTKGHHNKGHKDKGFKNVYHKEEYHHKKKFYDDFDNKKYHNKYDDMDKYVKGHKGSDFKGGHFKGGHHNDKYGSTDEKEEGEYHDNDYKVKDHFEHNKYYKDHHKHGNKKGFKAGYKEGHGESHDHGDHHDKKGHDDHHGHHSHAHEQHEEPPTHLEHADADDHEYHPEESQDRSYSKDSSVKIPKEPREEMREEAESLLTVVAPPKDFKPSQPIPPSSKRNYSGDEARSPITKVNSLKEGYKPKPSSSTAYTSRTKTARSRPRPRPSYIQGNLKAKDDKSFTRPSAFPQGGGLRIVSPPSFKLPLQPSTQTPLQSSVRLNQNISPHKPKPSNYKTPIYSGSSFTYGKKINTPSLKPSHVKSFDTPVESSYTKTSTSYLPLSSDSLTDHSTKLPTSKFHRPWKSLGFSNPPTSSESYKKAHKHSGFQRSYKPASQFRQKEETTLPVLTKTLPSMVKAAKYDPQIQPVSKVRQSLKYRSQSQPFILPKAAPLYYHQPVDKQLNNRKHSSSPLSTVQSSSRHGGQQETTLTRSFSHPQFENFGDFGQVHAARLRG